MNFTVYRSSAGSGKTFTLVREYLAIALSDTAFPPQRYKEILAITFTNKAAGEMKERIIRALKELSGKPAEISSPLSSALQEKLMLDPFTLAERAGNVLKAILHNYGDFAIGTIDSFTHRIVRAFAHDLSLPVNFEVETDEEKIISEAVDLLVSRIGKDEMLTEILYSFSESRTEDEKNWQIESDLRDISRQLLREDGADFASRLRDLTPENFMTIRKKLLTFIRQFESKVIALASELHQRFRDHGLEEEDFAHGKTGIAGRIRAFANGRLEKFGDGNKNVTKTLASGKFHSTKATAAKVAAINALVPEITSVFAQMDALQEKEFGDYILRGMMLKNIFALAVLNEIEKIIFSFRTEDNIIHISEFNRIISRVVAGEPAPFIYERLGERYRNYLIDEFQDTSVTQWHNLLPLIENALGGNNFTMVVGDSKQAIYRWRSGDVEQFARLPAVPSAQDSELLLQREASLKRNYREEKLGTNFRSKSEIVNFNNGFFRKLSEETGPYAEEIYRGIEQEFRKENAGGYVRIEAVPEEEERNANAVHLEKTITLIRDLLAEGFRHSDIAVLTRTNREGSETAKLLVENGIPVLSPDSLLLQHSAAVGFVVSILKIIENPSDEIATASVTEFLVRFGKTSGTYHENLAATTEPGGLAALCAANGIAFEPETLSRRPLYQRCEEIISVFGLSSSLDSYLLFFLDEVLSWSSSKSASRTDFFTWWDDRRQRASVVIPEGMDAVKVMTIHKSKGLEFPVVILPFASWDFKVQKKEIWITPEDELVPELETALVSTGKNLLKTKIAGRYTTEETRSHLDMLNLLYVAMTRPEKRLYVFTGKVKEIKSPPVNVSQCFAFYLQTLKAEGDCFESGTREKPSHAGPPVSRVISAPAGDPVSWYHRVKIRSLASDFGDGETRTNAAKGKMLHRVLSLLKDRTGADEAIRKAAALGWIPEDDRDYFLREVNGILSIPELEECFDTTGNFIERKILVPGSGNYRPDRVTIKKEKCIVLDYKTGKALPAHRAQLDGYGDLLKKMGYREIEKKLVYTENGEVISWQ